MIVEIEITQQDIDVGIPLRCGECPTALAFARVFTECRVSVKPTVVSFFPKDGRASDILWTQRISWFHLMLPPEMVQFVDSFDDTYWDYQAMKLIHWRPSAYHPITARFEVPEEVVRALCPGYFERYAAAAG